VQCKDHEKKANQLTERMKEVVGSVEGARVHCPLRRLRLRLMGLPFNAASDIVEAVAKLGGGGSGGFDPGRSASDFGVGTTCVDCPSKVALRAAEAVGLTLGWT